MILDFVNRLRRPRKWHVDDPRATCLEASYLPHFGLRRVTVLLDEDRWGEWGAITIPAADAYIPWDDVCRTCLSNLRATLRREQRQPADPE